MEKKPKIFQNNKIVTKTNSRTSYSDNTKINAYEELNRIFKNNKKICGIELEIITNKKKYKEKIITKTDNFLLTNNNEKIYIKDIKNVIEIK